MRIVLAFLLLCLCASGVLGASYQGVQSFNWIDLTEQAAPATPSSATITLYAGTDHAFHALDGNGTNTTLASATGNLGDTLIFAGNVATAGTYYTANGQPGASEQASSSVTRLVIPVSGTITTFTWCSVQANATTDFKVWVGGATSTKIDATGANGTATTSIAVTVGSYVEVEFDAGTAPGAGTVTLYITP